MMDEVDWLTHWRQVFADLDLVSAPSWRSRPTPTESHLSRLEGVIKCGLPASYRAFVKVIGPGYLARSFKIFAPGYRGATVIDFLSNNKWQEEEAGRRENPEQVRRLVAFADFGYDYFVWDTGEVTDPAGPEYRIYYVPRQHDEPLLRINDSFASFIQQDCLGGGYWGLIGGVWAETWEDDEGQVRSSRCFDPVCERPRSAV